MTYGLQERKIQSVKADCAIAQGGHRVSFYSPPSGSMVGLDTHTCASWKEAFFMAVSKSRRFEIFKRDGFTCQYCGQRPPEVILEVDHVDPRAAGGSDDEINLITSCADCNRGKSDKTLGEVRPRPDADIAYLEIQQELAEARRYLDAKSAKDSIYAEVMDALDDVTLKAFKFARPFYDSDSIWRPLLAEYTPEEIEAGLWIVGPRYRSGLLEDDSRAGVARYLRGVLRRRREA